MRPSSLGGGRILRRTLSVRLSVCLTVCPSVRLSVRPVIITERHVVPPSELQWHTCTFGHALTASVLFDTHWGHQYFSARTEGRISYGHLGRTNSCFIDDSNNESPSVNILMMSDVKLLSVWANSFFLFFLYLDQTTEIHKIKKNTHTHTHTQTKRKHRNTKKNMET